jgi:extradiol dioxygenase family protein
MTSLKITFTPAVPILRMHDVDAARRFYVDYLGCSVDWQDGEGDQPVYPFLNPGIEDGPADGRTMELIDPSSNRLRFFQRRTTG